MITRNELKFIKTLKQKKTRIKEGLFVVEGLKNVTEVLGSGFHIDRLLVTEKYKKHFAGHSFELIGERDLNAISSLKTNTTCLATARMKLKDLSELNFRKHIIVLDGVSDPGNLGTIIRAMDWFGYDQLVCSRDCADFYNTKAITSTMGSFSRILPVYTDIKSFLGSNPQIKFALTLNGKPFTGISKEMNPSTFILGSESHGVSKDILNEIDEVITIEKIGEAESLNVAMATTILLYQLRS